jgi:hypothetical protein
MWLRIISRHPTVSRKIFFEKGVFLRAVRHRDFRIRHHRTEARAVTIRTEWRPAPAISSSLMTFPTEVVSGSCH